MPKERACHPQERDSLTRTLEQEISLLDGRVERRTESHDENAEKRLGENVISKGAFGFVKALVELLQLLKRDKARCFGMIRNLPDTFVRSTRSDEWNNQCNNHIMAFVRCTSD